MLAYGISFMSGTGGLHGWSWIFVRFRGSHQSGCVSKVCFMQIIEGLFTIVIGITAYFGEPYYQGARDVAADVPAVLPDLPGTAMFLTPEERAYVIHRKSRHLGLIDSTESA